MSKKLETMDAETLMPPHGSTKIHCKRSAT